MLIERLRRPYGANRFEIVEKKGLGHPDTLCDGISDAVSRALSRYYLDHFGRILHHNVDKVLLIGGRSRPAFGGGEIERPMAIVIGGRATDDADGTKIPVDDIARDATERFLRKTLRNLDGHFTVEPRIGQGSSELRGLVGRVAANDTSIGLGYAPLSRLEEDVTRVEPLVRSVRGVGEDVKVMAVRQGDGVQLTIAAAMVAKYVDGRGEYDALKRRVEAKAAGRVAPGWADLSAIVNSADHDADIYLTVTGTSAEMGDDGETGRGNRPNGLITPGRPMTMEATAGKNPVSHVGKLYNIAAGRMAGDIAAIEGVEEAYVYLVSRIGAPIDEPQIRSASIYGRADRKRVEAIVGYWLEHLPDITEDFVHGRA